MLTLSQFPVLRQGISFCLFLWCELYTACQNNLRFMYHLRCIVYYLIVWYSNYICHIIIILVVPYCRIALQWLLVLWHSLALTRRPPPPLHSRYVLEGMTMAAWESSILDREKEAVRRSRDMKVVAEVKFCTNWCLTKLLWKLLL